MNGRLPGLGGAGLVVEPTKNVDQCRSLGRLAAIAKQLRLIFTVWYAVFPLCDPQVMNFRASVAHPRPLVNPYLCGVVGEREVRKVAKRTRQTSIFEELDGATAKLIARVVKRLAPEVHAM